MNDMTTGAVSRLLLILPIVLAGCAPKMPMSVVQDEYEVYSAWIRHHFEKQPPHMLYLASRTFSLASHVCKSKAMKEAGADESMVQDLVALGEAQFPLNLHVKSVQIPWAFKETDSFPYGFPTDEPGTYRWVALSRVAFNRKHTKALFAVSDACGGLCGGGGVVLGMRENRAWIFKQGGCAWVY